MITVADLRSEDDLASCQILRCEAAKPLEYPLFEARAIEVDRAARATLGSGSSVIADHEAKPARK